MLKTAVYARVVVKLHAFGVSDIEVKNYVSVYVPAIAFCGLGGPGFTGSKVRIVMVG